MADYASEKIETRAAAVLGDHKRTCPRCGDPKYQMCDTGRGLLNHLWDCQEAAARSTDYCPEHRDDQPPLITGHHPRRDGATVALHE